MCLPASAGIAMKQPLHLPACHPERAAKDLVFRRFRHGTPMHEILRLCLRMTIEVFVIVV